MASCGPHALGGTSGPLVVLVGGHGTQRELVGPSVSHYETITTTNGPHGNKGSEGRPRLDPQPRGRFSGGAPTNTHTTDPLQVFLPTTTVHSRGMGGGGGGARGMALGFHRNSHSWDGVSQKRPAINLVPPASGVDHGWWDGQQTV